MALAQKKLLDKRRLRRRLLLFFLLLAVPTALLLHQSWKRLKWENFHTQQKSAMSLVGEIDRYYAGLVQQENQRPFTDFSFLNVSADKSSGLRRSPLSELPASFNMPGLIGHFQVDGAGGLSTPLLPEIPDAASQYGVQGEELQQRLEVLRRIRKILTENELVQKVPETIAVLEEGEAFAGDTAYQPQVAFDKTRSAKSLSKQKTSELKSRKQVKAKKSAEPTDMVLQQSYPVSKSEKSSALKRGANSRERRQSPRVEQNALPEAMMADSDAMADVAGIAGTAMVRTFASTVDAFELGQLDSGHLVLFRKVWQDQQRYVQGLLLEKEGFLARTLTQAFEESTLAENNSLLASVQGNMLIPFKASQPAFENEQLYRSRLSAPLGGVELVFRSDVIPAGVGGSVLLWLGALLASVLCGGFYLLYRLMLGQINLLQQQQSFVSSVSHELKTPLTSIRMYGELLKQGWASEEKKRSYYDYIFDESERLSRLINNVLQLARLDRNEQSVELEPVAVETLIAEVQAKVATQMEGAGFVLHCDIPQALLAERIAVDRDWFLQIMINLIDNSLKFAADAEIKQVDLRCELVKQDQLQFTVRDYGPGIPRKQLKKIFELFYRAEDELTRKTVGTGIGLSLVQQMVNGMGGTITASNTKPGVAFQLVFSKES